MNTNSTMRNDSDNAILQLTYRFALEIIRYTAQLDEVRKYALSNQLLRCGTSIGANVREAQNAESKADFIHKMKVAAKEADESAYWLELCRDSPGYPPVDDLLPQLTIIQKILSKIIGTTKRTMN